MVPPDPSGVTDYGHLLNQALRRKGLEVDEHWSVNSATGCSAAAHATINLLRRAMAIPPGTATLWHYSSFAYGMRGIPLPGVLFGVVVRIRGGTVITIVHEAVYPWGRRGWRGGLQALTQRVALLGVILGSHVLVVTTSGRAELFGRLPRPLARAVEYLPVFSTIGEPAEPAEIRDRADPPVVGVLSHSSEGAMAELLFEAVARLPREIVPRIVLLGAPGPSSRGGLHWQSLARRRAMEQHLEFTGVLPEGQLGERLRSCDLILFLDPDGPTSRKTTLAAGLAHGMPIIAVDGPDRWVELVDRGAVVLVSADGHGLALAIAGLLASPERRRDLGGKAQAFYRERMGLDLVAAGMSHVIAETMQGRSPPGPREGVRRASGV